MAKRKQLHLDERVFSFVATSPVTWASWNKGMGSGADRFREAISITIADIMNRSDQKPYSAVLNESGTLVGILQVLLALHPHKRLTFHVCLNPEPNHEPDLETVQELMTRWPEMPSAARLTYLCYCYSALFQGRSTLGPAGRKHITLDAVMGIAALFGIAVER